MSYTKDKVKNGDSMGKIKYVVIDLNAPSEDAIDNLQNFIYENIEAIEKNKEFEKEIKPEKPPKSA